MILMEAAMITENFKNAAPRWYTGKTLTNLLALLPGLAESEAQGFWVPGVSRKLAAALNKLSTATKKVAKQADAFYQNSEYGGGHPHNSPAYHAANKLKRAWFEVHMAMYYCSGLAAANEALAYIEQRDELLASSGKRDVFRLASDFVRDLLPVQSLIATLDATRPKPVFTSLGLSPTVTATLTEQLKLCVATVRFPEFEDEWIERVVKGKTVRVCVTTIKWPEGTRHGASRFACRQDGCHACGHAIRNPFNWVPFVMDDKRGVPHSFWVGRDCAKNIFNVDVKGDCEWAPQQVTSMEVGL